MDRILFLGLGTLFFFGLGGILIIEYGQGKDFFAVLIAGRSIPFQLLAGLVYGLLASGLAWFIITREFFRQERNFYHSIFSNWDLNYPKIIFISLCAGIGEELFFRAGIQPLIGIWWTSFIFVALHGYLSPFNWRISVYGILMLIVMAGIGYMFETSGLITVMTAHAVFDMVLFALMMKQEKGSE